MFLFSHKTKTPISTYSDSYRAPTSIKEVYKDPPLWAWEANKFVTPGLTQTMRRHVDPEALQKMVKCAVQDYSYKGSIPGHPYLPEKYWLFQEEADNCNPNYLCGNQYNKWRMGPYNCTGWNKCTTYLPRLPKEAGMETVVRGMPLVYPPKPERLNAYEREVVVNMLNSLRGMDYCVAGPPCIERRLRPSCAEQPTVRSVSPCEHRAGMQCAVITPPPSYYPCPNLRWDTSHFKKTGGPQRNNYVVHPEFVSENYPDYHCW
uniref:Spermatid-specific manchette-related protein 1 n=1 Tax=Camelus bactrianus TaxID=9837 RepID=A0A9W3F6F5_CAMBA|nr:spermatid-specific manchette-related protein 1 [Camelus bactrianus]